MENIISLPDSDERKARLNENFRNKNISYDLLANTFQWRGVAEEVERFNTNNYQSN